MGFISEQLHCLEVDERVNGPEVALVLALVHVPTELDAPLCSGKREGHVAGDGAQSQPAKSRAKTVRQNASNLRVGTITCTRFSNKHRDEDQCCCLQSIRRASSITTKGRCFL